jgi:hypothetical protein
MTRLSDERVLQLLRSELPPPTNGGPAPDLWPRVWHRLQHGSGARASAFDWLLAAAVVTACLTHPATLTILLFHV